VFRAYRWRVLLKPVKIVPIGPLLESTLVGFSAIYVLGRPAELARPLWLKRRENVALTASIATLIAERCLDMICLVALFAWALLTLEISAEPATVTAIKTTAWGTLIAFIAGLLALIAFSRKPEKVLRFVPFSRVRALAASFADGLASLKSPSSLGSSLFYSAVVWLVIVFQFWFLFLSMGFDLTVSAATLVLGVTAIGSLFQIPAIGGGFQAAVMWSLQTFFLVSKEQAIAAALVAWVTSYAPTILFTGLYLAVSGVQFGELKSALRQGQAARH
jgi:uncharacterized protein (TIRG00374 family)